MNYVYSAQNAHSHDVLSDDLAILHLQYSTQWDGLCHVGAVFDVMDDGQPLPVYYKGFRAGEHVVGPERVEDCGLQGEIPPRSTSQAKALGIENMAATGVQGQGVMIDLRRHFGDGRTVVGHDRLMQVIEADGIEVAPGDMLCLHTGLADLILDMRKDPEPSVIHGSCAVLDGGDPALQDWIRDSGISVSLALAGVVGIYMLKGLPSLIGILATAPKSSLSSYELLTIPMFILMAEFTGMSGISRNLFRAVSVWAGRLKGGLGISTVITGAHFGAVSGSSTAAAATLARTSIPAMLEEGYSARTAAGIVAMAGTIAMLIPPSVALIFYGLLSGTNISLLLIAGIVPGLLVTLVLSVTIWATTASRADAPRHSWPERIASLWVALPFLGLFGAVTGLIYTGIATPVESSAIGAMAALVFTVANGTCSFDGLKKAFVNTCVVTAMIGLIIVCAQIFGDFITLSGIARSLAAAIGGADVPIWGVMTVIVLMYLFLGLFLDLFLGLFLDLISILILTVPVMLPVVQQLGLDPIWFGIVIILLAEIGIVTPPVGMNVFVVSSVSGIPLKECFAGVLKPILAVLFLVIALVIWPGITLWLPNTMH